MFRSTFTFSIFFFFSAHMNSNITWIYCAGDKIHCLCTVYALFTGSTALFTHLKMILLQCFQFSVSAKISCIQTDPVVCVFTQHFYLYSWSNLISSCNFFVYFKHKKLLFLFYILIFTKYSYQSIYSQWQL